MISDSKLGKDKSTVWKVLSVIAFVIYFPIGVFISIVTIAQIMLLFVTIIGIPMAIILVKSLPTYFNPINKICVSVAVAEELNLCCLFF